MKSLKEMCDSKILSAFLKLALKKYRKYTL